MKKKYALVSVFDKKNLSYLCNNLKKFKYDFLSTGSTCSEIKKLGFKCEDISKVTKIKEIIGGRVKSLNQKIYGSILFSRDNKKHNIDFKKLNIPQIDIVIVNTYPFSKSTSNDEEVKIEMIDIGGISLIRAASKNFKFVTSICKVNDYEKLINNLRKNKGKTDLKFRKRMAAKTFKETSIYDNDIYNWFSGKKSIKEKIGLRYGENPDQKAYLLRENKRNIFNYQLNGKKISYNNIIDVDAGYSCIQEFKEPTCVIIKHTNPCGVASGTTIQEAFKKARACDEKSAFGGIVLLNRKIDAKFAHYLSQFFFEIIVTNQFTKDALDILKNRKNLILLKINYKLKKKREIKNTVFGDVYQDVQSTKINKSYIKLVSSKKASLNSIKDLLFSLKVVKHLKSNAIVLSNNKQTIGLGIGHTNRVDSLNFAIKKMKENFKLKKFVCVSDGFFPFDDSMKSLKNNNCTVIAKPSGSVNDKKIIKFAKNNDMSLYFTKNRLFKH